MAQTAESAVLLQSNDGSKDSAVLYKLLFDKKDRFIRALKLVGIFWGLAICMIPIPVVHLTILPAFIVAGPIAAVFRFRALEANEHVLGTCPVCNKDIKIAVEANEQPPMHKYCPACDKPIQVLVP